MTMTAVYSPGYQLPLFLGPAQLRLWRRLDRLIGARTFAASTVRGLAAELGANPGSVSRDLDALARLGLAVHDTTWGRAGVRLWRVVARGGRRGLDPRRQRRAWLRMGVRAVPGQATMFEADDRESVPPADRSPTASPVPIPAGEAVNPGSEASLHGRDATPAGASQGGDAPAGPFAYAHCACGRPRIVKVGEPAPDCTHG